MSETLTKKRALEMLESVAGKVAREIAEKNAAQAQERAAMEDKSSALALVEMLREKQGGMAEKQGDGQSFGRFVRCIAAGKGSQESAIRHAKAMKDDEMVKALSESSFSGGGALVPEQIASEVIPLLTAKTVVRRMGVDLMQMTSDTMSLPKIASGATSNYVGENKNAPISEPSFGSVTLTARKLITMVPVSNDLLRDSNPRADSIVRNDMLRAMRLKEDITLIRSDGSESEPKGLRYWADAANVSARTQAGAKSTTEEKINDLAGMIGDLEDNDVDLQGAGFILNPRTVRHLWVLRDTNGQFLFRDEISAGLILGYPFAKTTQIPKTLGGGDETEAYFAAFPQLILGDRMSIELSVHDGAAYYDGSTVQSGLSLDQTLMKCLSRHDFASRFDGKDISVRTNVDWYDV